MKKKSKREAIDLLEEGVKEKLQAVVDKYHTPKKEEVVEEKVEEPKSLKLPVNEEKQSLITESLRAKIKEAVKEQLTPQDEQDIKEAQVEAYDDYIDEINAAVKREKNDDWTLMKLESEIEQRILEMDYAKLRLEHKLADIKVLRSKFDEMEKIDEKLQKFKDNTTFKLEMVAKMEGLKNKHMVKKIVEKAEEELTLDKVYESLDTEDDIKVDVQ